MGVHKAMERMRSMDVEQIYDLWREYAAAVNAADIERWLSLWVDDGIMISPGKPRFIGKEQIREELQTLVIHTQTQNMIVNTEEVQILGDWAYAHGIFELDNISLDGNVIHICGAFLDVLKKQSNGSWKIAIDCHNHFLNKGGES